MIDTIYAYMYSHGLTVLHHTVRRQLHVSEGRVMKIYPLQINMAGLAYNMQRQLTALGT